MMDIGLGLSITEIVGGVIVTGVLALIGYVGRLALVGFSKSVGDSVMEQVSPAFGELKDDLQKTWDVMLEKQTHFQGQLNAVQNDINHIKDSGTQLTQSHETVVQDIKELRKDVTAIQLDKMRHETHE